MAHPARVLHPTVTTRPPPSPARRESRARPSHSLTPTTSTHPPLPLAASGAPASTTNSTTPTTASTPVRSPSFDVTARAPSPRSMVAQCARAMPCPAASTPRCLTLRLMTAISAMDTSPNASPAGTRRRSDTSACSLAQVGCAIGAELVIFFTPRATDSSMVTSLSTTRYPPDYSIYAL